MRKFIAVGFLFYIWAYLISINAQIASFPSSGGSVSQAYSTIQDEGSSLTQRNTVNFSGPAVSCVDNSGSARTDCTIAEGTTASQNITDVLPTKTSGTVLTIASGRWGHGTTSPAPHPGTTFTIGSLSISGCTNASPIVCTVSSVTGTSLRNGDTIIVSGVLGNTAANGTWIADVQTSTTIALTGSTGNGAYSGGGTISGTGDGTAVIYGTPQGYIVIDSPASAALILTCSSTCIMNQSTTPTVPSDGLPIASVTITTGAWNTLTDTRRFLNAGQDAQGGDGTNVTCSAGTCTVSVDSTVARTTGTNSFTGSNDFTLATRTAPFRTGSGAPSASCTLGDVYFRTSGVTAGQNVYLCTATNTWTQVTAGTNTPNFTSTTYLTDEFIQGGSSTLWGQLGWRGAPTAGSGTTVPTTGVSNHPGIIRLTTSAGNGDGVTIDLRGSGGTINSTSAMNGSAGVGYAFNIVFKTSASGAANERIEFGWADAQFDSANNSIGINFIPSIPQTKFQCTLMSGGVRNHVDTGVTVSNDTWYNATVAINSAGVLTCTVNNTTVTNSSSFPTAALGPGVWLQNMTAAAQTLDIDWINLAIPNTGR